MTTNEPGDPELEKNFRMLAGMSKVSEKKGCDHDKAVYCDNCKPPQSWFDAVRPGEMPDEVNLDNQKIMTLGPGPQLISERRVQLVVLRADGTYRYYPMHKHPGGWKIDSTWRVLVIGTGMGRIIIPLETIDYFSPQEY